MRKPKSKIDAADFRSRLHAWFQANGRDLPWRRTRDPYAIMVSEFMLQQTQVATVMPYFQRWLARFPSFAALAAASEDDVLSVWQGLGYYSRARNLHRAAQCVVAEHGGTLPSDVAAILRLPGVGRYTAGAIASFAFDLPVAAVDANIARVLARLMNLRLPIDSQPGNTALWAAADALLPADRGALHTSALMELGALVCTSAKPKCLICPVRSDCRASDPESLPMKGPRRQTALLTEHCAWIPDADRILLEQQHGARWRGMWKLPAIALPRSGEAPLLQLEYPFTHHRVTLSIFSAPLPTTLADNQRWVNVADLAEVALPSPHRRALIQLLERSAP